MNTYIKEVKKLNQKIDGDFKNVNLEEENLYAVAFIDILGFSSMIKKDPKGTQYIPLIKDALNSAMHLANLNKELLSSSIFDYRIFSDNICFWTPLKYKFIAIANMFAVLSEFQLQLINKGLLCRGGVSMGFHYVDEYMLYGPALVEAVELEHSTTYPQITISEKIINNIDLVQMSLQLHYFHKLSVNGSWFINYLQKVFYVDKKESLNIIEYHRTFINQRKELFKLDSKIIKKYNWASRYHNDIISRLTFKNECAKI